MSALMSLLWHVRHYGIRAGWSIWLYDVSLHVDERHAQTWRPFHGERPSLRAYRRRR